MLKCVFWWNARTGMVEVYYHFRANDRVKEKLYSPSDRFWVGELSRNYSVSTNPKTRNKQ